MRDMDLIRFLSSSAKELIGKAQCAAPAVAKAHLDEAEEMMALASAMLTRDTALGAEAKEAA